MQKRALVTVGLLYINIYRNIITHALKILLSLKYPSVYNVHFLSSILFFFYLSFLFLLFVTT